MDNDLKLTALYYRIDKGLIDRGSDLYFTINMIKELQNEIEDLRSERTASRITESIRSDTPRRPKEKRVRKRKVVRKEGSTTETNTMEGG